MPVHAGPADGTQQPDRYPLLLGRAAVVIEEEYPAQLKKGRFGRLVRQVPPQRLEHLRKERTPHRSLLKIHGVGQRHAPRHIRRIE